MKKIQTIRDIEDIRGKTVLLRLGLNVPIKNGGIVDDFRIRKSIPTIKYLKKRGARVVIISHIGRDKKSSLRPVAEYMNKYLKVGFIPGAPDDKTRAIIEDMKNGAVVMLENLRISTGERSNSIVFAKKLASLGDIYVNDAFSVSHREHASIVSLPKLLPSYYGFLMEEEITHLSIAVHRPKHPFLFILGGAKFKTKMPLIKKYINTADYVFVGGALANNFFKELGFPMDASLTENTGADIKALLHSKKLILPSDVVVENSSGVEMKKIEDIEKSDTVVDVGQDTIQKLKEIVSSSKLIVFNGPLGNYEIGFGESTKKTLRAIAEADAISIIGGGDTAYLACHTKCEKKCTFISTGGGATIEFLAKGTLPGIEALRTRERK